VVLLHGVDKRGELGPHRLLGGGVDLRPTVAKLVARGRIEPVILAAPSQTAAAASSRSLWTPAGFELASFVARVAEVLRRRGGPAVDRQRVAVLGHSGAGCHLTPGPGGGNGLFRVATDRESLARRGIRIQWLGLMDTCFFGAFGARWLRRALSAGGTRLAAIWTGPERWGHGTSRRVRAFTRGLGPSQSVRAGCDRSRYASCRELRPQARSGAGSGVQGFVLHARRAALAKAFGGRLTPHQGLTHWLVERLLLRWLGRTPGSA
jgi:hypothetical protein